jgi:hypothetical protein
MTKIILRIKIFHEWEKNIENVIGAKQIPKTFSMLRQKYINAIESLINMKFYFTCNWI